MSERFLAVMLAFIGLIVAAELSGAKLFERATVSIYGCAIRQC